MTIPPRHCQLMVPSFVEFETSADLKSAVEKLDGREFKGATVHCTPDVSLSHLLHVPSLTICRSKTSDQMLEATVSEVLHVAATTSTTTVVALHRHEAIVHEHTVSDLLAEDHRWMITMTEGMADVLLRETILLHLLGGTRRILTMLGALLHQPEVTIHMHDTRTRMRDHDLLHEATLAAAAAAAAMEAMMTEDTDPQVAQSSILQRLGCITGWFGA